MRIFEITRKFRITSVLYKVVMEMLTEGFLMAENPNEYFSSVFTMEDISIIIIVYFTLSVQSKRLKWVHKTCKVYLLKLIQIIYNLRH